MEPMSTVQGDTADRLSVEDAARLRDVLMVRLRRRGATLGVIAFILGSSPATVHRRLKAMPDVVRRELEAVDLGGVI